VKRSRQNPHKFAARGFSEALRMEVLDQPGIRICTVLPSVIDTPFFEHAANFSHHKVRAMPPVYAPEKVAEVVVGLVERPRVEVVVGGAGKLATVLNRSWPPRRHPARRPCPEPRFPRR
jgi:short-subunit dehydrogenase